MPTIDLNSTFGAFLIGVVLSAGLFGVTCSQVFYYAQNYTSDGILIKGAVATLLILEGVHSAFSIHAVYYYLILNYFNPPGLLQVTWSAIAALSFGHFATGIAATVNAFELEFLNVISRGSPGIAVATLSLAVATDVFTAASLSFYLHTSRSGIESTDTLVNKLMTYAINNAILISLFNITVLTFLIVEGGNLVYISIFDIVVNLYTNSMMATLNARRSISNSSTASGSGYIVNSFKAANPPTAVSIEGGPEFSTDSIQPRLTLITFTEEVQAV
ncbi:hypothetical protein GALMADRAFT_145359 [Galerina marginata CBS 339.88]|uniref:DUF6534 domain-containing protein n=1 Tax=Galerina marginata (strain CBS 339.88) TaxID=685588 RepID=A0A067SHY2_GALM3|nr:hypothetical protein GALMADRAFT_145359 [Galerina marginata CBS 339.88]